MLRQDGTLKFVNLVQPLLSQLGMAVTKLTKLFGSPERVFEDLAVHGLDSAKYPHMHARIGNTCLHTLIHVSN